MCKLAGIHGHKTNHSLRATATSRLDQAGIDEQLVMEVTGHRSLEGVRSYKRTSDTQREVLSDILNCSKRPRVEPNTAVTATLPSMGTAIEPLSSATEFSPTMLSTATTLVQPPSNATVFSAKHQSHHLHALSLPHAVFTNCTVYFFIGMATGEGENPG